MIRRAAFLGLLVACGGAASPEPASPTAPTPFPAITLEKSPESGQVDKVGQTDGALKPDGVNDLAFALSADGAVKAIFLVAVDERGHANGKYEADTLVGDQEVPKEISTKWGKNTAGLGVAERGALVNTPDGSIPALPSGNHAITLYVAQSPVLAKGTKLRVYVQRPDGVVNPGGTVALD